MSEVVTDRVKGHPSPRRVAFFPDGESMTKQSEMEACDINNILRRFVKTGLLEHRMMYEGRYEDVADAVDYQSALNMIQSAEEMFMTVPAKVRAEFQNDPGLFLKFVQDPANGARMVELGLAVERPKPSGSSPEGSGREAPSAEVSPAGGPPKPAAGAS